MANNSSKWAGAALVAGVVGYVAGVLTAPKSGKETRADIKQAANRALTETEKKLKLVHAELNKALDKAIIKAGSVKGKAKADLDKVIAQAKDAKEKVREVLSAIHEGDADDPELNQALQEAKQALKHLEKYIKT